MEEHEVNSIYEGNKITGLSVSSLKNAADKGNAIITRALEASISPGRI